MNDYDHIANIYGQIKKLVFSDQLERMEVKFLIESPPNSKLLVVGCGQATFLRQLNPNSFTKITLVDKSAKMLQIAKNNFPVDNIEFINGDWVSLKLEERFDIIALPFILDCIPEDQISAFFDKAVEHCVMNGEIIITDFQKSSIMHLFSVTLIKLMYLFFSISTQIGRMKIPSYETLINQNSLQNIGHLKHKYYPIFSARYRKL